MTPLQTIDLLLVALAGLSVVTWVSRRLRCAPDPHVPAKAALPSPARWGGEAVIGPVLGYLTGYGMVMTGAGALGVTAPSLVVQLLAGSGAHLLGAIVCLWIAATQYEGGLTAFLLGTNNRWSRDNVRRGTGILLVALGLCPVVLWVTVKLLTPFMPELGTEIHPTIQLLHAPDTPIATIALLWLAAVVIAPAAEELFFRGILQSTLRNWYGNPWWAIAATSAVFALVHSGQPATLPAIYFLSALLGYLYENNANILAPIIVHSLFNARTMLWETFA